MSIRKCENGHLYDSAIHTVCPYCNGGIYRVDFGAGNDTIGATTLLDEEPVQTGVPGSEDIGKTVLLDEDVEAYAGAEDTGRTVLPGGDISPLPPDENAVAPGRLICTQGADMGREIVLRAGETLRIRDGNYIFVPFWSER